MGNERVVGYHACILHAARSHVGFAARRLDGRRFGRMPNLAGGTPALPTANALFSGGKFPSPRGLQVVTVRA